MNYSIEFTAAMILVFVASVVWIIFKLLKLNLQIRPGSTTPARMTLFGAVICSACGYLNGEFISRYATHLQSNDWFYTPAFIIGAFLSVLGYIINKVSDRTLIQLRKNNSDTYSIPFGGAYPWISCPNYLGEIITCIGFSCAAWSIAGITLAVRQGQVQNDPE